MIDVNKEVYLTLSSILHGESVLLCRAVEELSLYNTLMLKNEWSTLSTIPRNLEFLKRGLLPLALYRMWLHRGHGLIVAAGKDY